jgi:SpoVK/Ycf46/Vps4 family AAA+-type ATPase
MAAEVIANHLQLNLYRIDLSAVVSKYIGETEKNLARMFREAESGGVVLFFDEADALFGKRTEIRDSHDRYANIEINYLLQRMEAYRGLAILATNMKSALDTAFVRRLRFVVNFPYPSPAERRLIWEKVFPGETRTEGLDLDRLATLNFTGGNIFTVAINAAFMAAQDGAPVTMSHVLEAARAETRKLERPVYEREFELRERAVGA